MIIIYENIGMEASMKLRHLLLSTITTVALLSGCSESKESTPAPVSTVDKDAKKVVVYSSRKEHLVKPIFDLYTQKTGVKIQYITDNAGALVIKLKAEGENTPADMLITVDAGNLWQAANEGLLAKIESSVLDSNIAPYLRDTNNRWFGLSKRARTIVYSTDRVKPSELSTYEALADSQWKGRLCLRTSKKVYNQSLVATMIEANGEAITETVVKGWVANLATSTFSNDTKTMQAILAGQCDVAIVNTYYFGRLQTESPATPLALYWPNQQDRGVHINVSGAGITEHSKNKVEAQKLLEWFVSEEAQRLFADLNQEFPVLPGLASSEQVASWGTFKEDAVKLEVAGKNQVKAVKLMDRAGYN
jgi:iron(III) transport system substrate-binding protein